MNRLMRMFSMRRAMVVCIAAVFCSGVAVAEDQSPSEMIEEAIALFAETMDGNQEELAADKEALYAAVNEILLPRFDRVRAARAVLGKHRKTATDEQIERFTDAFYTTLLHRYSEGLLEFDAEKVEVQEFRGDVTGKSAKVKTTVLLEGGQKAPVDYLLANQYPGWLMLNVTIEGVSYIKTFRTEMDAEIRSTSLGAVIERLESEAGISSDG